MFLMNLILFLQAEETQMGAIGFCSIEYQGFLQDNRYFLFNSFSSPFVMYSFIAILSVLFIFSKNTVLSASANLTKSSWVKIFLLTSADLHIHSSITVLGRLCMAIFDLDKQKKSLAPVAIPLVILQNSEICFKLQYSEACSCRIYSNHFFSGDKSLYGTE